MAETKRPSRDTLSALETAPNMYLILSPDLYILTASDLYLQATKTTRDAIIGKHIFEAFPDNPDLPDADGVQNINASLQAVLRTKKPDQMPIQRYDVPDTENPGKFIRRYWDPCHSPVLDSEGNISYIIQLATNVTDKILAERALHQSHLENLETTEQVRALNAELLATNVELRETQHQLNLLNGQLEGRVAKRTDELRQAVEEQAAINEEMEATNEELIATQQHLEHINRELTAEESRFRMAVESTGLGTWDYIPATGELQWSKECRMIFGLDNDQPMDFETYTRHIFPEDREFVASRINSSLQSESSGRYEITHRIMRFDNKEVRWVKAQGTVQFQAGKASRFLGTALDITELKQVEEKSGRLAAIVATSNDAIISKTLESVITSWNDSAERMFGYTSAEMIGETIYKLIPADRQDEEPMILERLKAGDRVEHFETKRQTKDGRLIDVSLTISPIQDSRGNITGFSKIARDISERKQNELRKNDFIAMVSHEIKTPLTSMSAILQMLQRKFAESEDVMVPQLLDRANLQVKKMTTMINGFLNISRLESGKIQINRQAFNICELIKEVVAEINLTGINHIINIRECEDAVVMADREKIDSVLSNLLGNAIKYSPKGSEVTIDCYKQDSYTYIRVSDRGLGISEADCAHIFDRYYRVESDPISQASGFGIGLYLSAEIVHHHNGKIWVESEIGKGAQFYFSLPLEEIRKPDVGD
ncbi:PAS domain S-box-containing protein [Pedobacter africanus]|uniref:PAS domain S-box-containing protein n=1 Tax=Pedobacter africanus TaxID=151894 RepID=A0ACC6KRY7_9SPHI|nr:PAS domain S-box protein [Pedobacter africanus]MDR6781955.1 PAS domain S-box-containing protein [Pedobacter africanus]